MLPTPTSCKKGERRREVEREFKEGKGEKGRWGIGGRMGEGGQKGKERGMKYINLSNLI